MNLISDHMSITLYFAWRGGVELNGRTFFYNLKHKMLKKNITFNKTEIVHIKYMYLPNLSHIYQHKWAALSCTSLYITGMHRYITSKGEDELTEGMVQSFCSTFKKNIYAQCLWQNYERS